MASGYTGTVQDFTNAHKQVLDVKEQVDGILKNTANTVSGLASAWQGQAATAFNNLMERFQTDAKTLQDALQGIAEQLNNAGSTYQQQEEEHSAAMSNITSQLDG